MSKAKLNRPNTWQKQVNPNTQRMKNLMRDVRNDTMRLTRNSRDLDTWMEKLAPYTASNCFVTGVHADQVREIVNGIAGVVDRTSLPSGANAEIVKGTMAEACMTMVTNVGEDIKSELQRIAVESYNARNSPQETAKLIGEKIDSLSKTRCQAIARTETCRAANIANYLNAKEMGAKSYSVICNEGCCEYCQEAYGTDESGGVGDVVFDIEDTDDLPPYHPNCRCTPVWSTEPVETVEEETIEDETPIEPTPEQLQQNLTKDELDQWNWAKGVLEKDFIKEAGKQMARETLEELRQKALGDSTVKAPVKEPTVKEPVKPTPKAEPKTKSIENMTSDELYDSMTKADKAKYDKAKKKLESVEKNIKTIGENDLLLGMKKDRLLEIRNLEQKQRDKLQNKGKRKPKEKPVRTHERTLDNIHNDLEIPTKELIPKLEKWIDKRCKNVAEFGYNFDVKTGKLIGDEIRGKKGHVTLTDMGIGTGTIHSHPRNGMAAPSIEDLESFRCEKGQHHFMVAEHEIWYVEAKDSFGIGALGQQIDLQRAHKDCRDRAFKTVETEIKKGKIEATEEAIAKALDKYTGEEILKTFNSPPWSKTLKIKRYYR